MSRVLTNEQNYYDIADTIRQMKNVNTTYKPREMAPALKDIYSNEVEGTLPLSFEANGNNLLNYRIDGASGGVGDRTGNLFDGNLVNGYYTNNTLTTLTSTNGIYKSLKITLPAGTYTVVYSEAILIIRYIELNGDYMTNPAGKSTVESYTFTLNSNSTISLGFRNSTNTQWDDSIKIQVVTGSIVPSKYEPYGYKVPVVVNGKNLFNENAITNEILRDNDGTTNSNNNWRCSNFINIPQNNNNILISWESDSAYFQAKIAFYDNQKNFISLSNYGINNTYLITFNLPNNCEFIRFSYSQTVNNVPANRHNIQIILGSTATDYEPYHEPTTTNIYLDKPIEAKANIPSEYTEVEYLESTGTQYIDTNYTPVQGDDLEFKNVTINNFNGALFSAGIESYQLILLGLRSVCYYKYFQVGNAVASSFSTITNGNIKVLNGNLYINNVLKAEADYGGAVDTTLNIFRRANNTSNLIGKIGEIIISNNGIIKRDFIPCYRDSDNVAGLYDLVNNAFYTNQGTGNFIVGPIKENESISLSDTNVDIPTLDGTNILTIDTTVQPSNVYIQAPKDSLEAIQIANELEEI